jgi:hypothetical protein
MVSGSVATSYYAQPRMTRDIDVVVALEPADADRVATLFADEFYCDVEVIRDAARQRAMFNLIHTELVVKVDFIVRKDSAYRRTEFKRRRRVRIAGFETWIVSAEDLVLSKLVWAKPSRSELQLGDVRNLIVSVTDLDWPYLERWAADLDVLELLEEVRP